MRLLWRAGVLVLALGALAAPALADHNLNAAFAGRFDLDPNGRPGKLALRLVSEATARAAFKTQIVVTSPDVDCRRRGTQWYVGTFTTPNDHGPVAGCWPGGYRDLEAYFKSVNFGGKVGYLEIPVPPTNGSTYRAAATAVGDFSPPYEFFDLPIRFAGHFAGDGARDEPCRKPSGRAPASLRAGTDALRVPDITIKKEAAERYPHLELVLRQLWRTLNAPALWGSLWNENISGSGCITTGGRFKFSEIAAHVRQYLTDGSVTIEYRVQKSKVAAAQTVNRKRTILFQSAGREAEHAARRVYSDYFLARTLFHEMLHIFQYDEWNALARLTDYEGFPTALDPKLPKKFFSTKEYPDTGADTAPLPAP
jgi:hypothetical protein